MTCPVVACRGLLWQNAGEAGEPVHGEGNPEAGQGQAMYSNHGGYRGAEAVEKYGNDCNQVDVCLLWYVGLMYACLYPYR